MATHGEHRWLLGRVMHLKRQQVESTGIRLSYELDGKEVARAFLYIFRNDLHKEPVGYLEDVFVDLGHRRRGLGNEIVRQIIKEAQSHGCYKLVGTSRHSRPEVHDIYTQLGFTDWGREFRMDLESDVTSESG